MTSLIMMYLYYDKAGDIKSITPAPDAAFENEFSSATFLLSEVEGFLTGVMNPFDYQVKKSITLAGDVFKLIKKITVVNHTRTLDNYLTKIEERRPIGALLKIVNDPDKKILSIEITKEFKAMMASTDEDEEEIVSDFVLSGPSTVYITPRNNPYVLLFQFTFLPNVLFEREKLYFPYVEVYTNTSAYTKKLLDGYSYREKGTK